MRKRALLVVAIVIALAVSFWPKTVTQPQVTAPVAHPGTSMGPARTRPDPTGTLPGFLPREARDLIATIQHGGPFRHRQDGRVFGNRESLLPRKQPGYYREYTVDTPGVDHRGARRIVTGGDPPRFWYYTDDHYDSFRTFEAPARERPR